MFHSDFVALTGNHTRNFVARYNLGFHTTSSLCLGIELVGVRVRARVRIPRQIRHKSDANPAQIRRKSGTAPTQIRHSSDANPAQLRRKSGTAPAQIRRKSGTTCKKTFLLYYLCFCIVWLAIQQIFKSSSTL